MILAFVLGKFSERMDFMKGEIVSLQRESQTQEERDAISELFNVKFEAHERLDDLRFKAMADALADRLDKMATMQTTILQALNGKLLHP
jgi:hypothetical protein